MELWIWLAETAGGALLLVWAIPVVLAFARAVRQTKWNVVVSRYDIGEYTFWVGGSVGVILAVFIAVLLQTFNLVNFVFAATLLGGLAAYLVEWLSQQTLPEKHPWRVEIETMAAQMGVKPGEIRYRLCPQRIPYASPGGITLPSKALRSLDDAALRFTIVGALIARRRRREWIRLTLWLLGGLAFYSVYVVASFLDRPPPYVSLDTTLPYQIISSLLLLLWARKVPVYVQVDESLRWDGEALKHTGDMEAAFRAITKTDTSPGAMKRMERLKVLWDAYQQEQAAVKAGTIAALQPSNNQTQTLNPTP